MQLNSIIRSRRFLIVLVLAVLVAISLFGSTRMLRGSLTDDAVLTLGDTNQDGIFSVREMRKVLTNMIRAIALQNDQSYDLNASGTVDRTDLTILITSIRAFLGAECGNGTIQAGEQCDDDNVNNNDGCSAVCRIESGFMCTGSPSICTHAACGDGTFATKTDYQVSFNPTSIALADISGDGKTDLVALNIYNAVSTLLGNGDGTFAEKSDYLTHKHHGDFALADLDGDGDLDTVIANTSEQVLSVYLREPDGSIGDEVIHGQIGTAGGSVHIAIADLDHDSHKDIAISAFDSGNVLVLFGDGTGAFPVRRSYGPYNYGGDLAIADLNVDGNMDIVVSTQDKLSVFLGHGDRTFAHRQYVPSSVAPSSITIADLNHDGIPDLVTTNPRVDNFSVFLGNGDGTFAARQDYASASFPSSVIAADFNGDGLSDIAIVNQNSNTVSVFLGIGDGRFGSRHNYPTGLGPIFLSSIDLNGDHAVDLVSANYHAGTVSVLLGNVSGSCSAGL